jgi:hypothetical protein
MGRSRRATVLAVLWPGCVWLVGGAIATLATGCGSSGGPCDLDALLRQRAGAGAVSCGRVPVGGPTDETDRCIADQTASGQAFYARYDMRGIDSLVALGALRDAAGRVSVLQWDSDPSGGGNAGARIIEIVCGGDPPIQTPATRPDAAMEISCTVVVDSHLACGR